MNQKLTIPRKLNEESIEELLGTLLNSSDELDFQVPPSIEYKGFGILPYFFLLLFTWVRNKKGKLIVAIESTNKDSLEKFALDYYGYIILFTAWKKCDIVNIDGESLKDIFKAYNQKMYNKIDFLEGLPNEAVMIPCFDHFSKERGLSHWLYDSNFEFAEAPSSLDNSVYRIFEVLTKSYKSRIVRNTKLVIEDIQKILWELLKNTDEHATKDHLNQTNLMPSVRGVFIKVQRSSQENFVSNSRGHLGLSRYYKSGLQNGNDSFILEISIFDSGPGLAKRFLGKHWSNTIQIKDEIETVKRCLIKGQTSVSSIKSKNKGYGLDDVLRLLDSRKGFLKIRTGRVSVFRDFIESPYKETTNLEDVDLYDWSKSSNDDFSEMNPVDGTLITLAYPIN